MFGKYQNSITRPILRESFFLLFAFPRSFRSIKMQGVGKSSKPGFVAFRQDDEVKASLKEAFRGDLNFLQQFFAVPSFDS